MALCASPALPGCTDLLGDYSIETCTCRSDDCAASECLFWAQRYGDGDDQFIDAIAVDAANDIVLVGHAAGAVDFGGGARTSGGDYDLFIAKLDMQGRHQWSVRFGDTAADHARAVAIDPAGNILVTGEFAGTVHFGKTTLTSLGGGDVFVLKLSPEGEVLWATAIGGPFEQLGVSIATDPSGNVIVGGCFEGVVLFTPELVDTSVGGQDVFVLKLDPDGNHVWRIVTGGTENDCASRVATDSAGNVVVAGNFSTLVDFGSEPLASAGSLDTFLVELDPKGKHRWSQWFGDAGVQIAGSLAVSPEGDVALAGNHEGSVVIGKDTLASADAYDAFIALFDGDDGKPKWSRPIGGAGEQGIYGTTFDSQGNVVISGATGPSSLSLDPFLTKLDPKGEPIWSRTWKASGNQVSNSLAADASDNLVLGGYFMDQWKIGDTGLTSTGSNDAFIAKVGP